MQRYKKIWNTANWGCPKCGLIVQTLGELFSYKKKRGGWTYVPFGCLLVARERKCKE